MADPQKISGVVGTILGVQLYVFAGKVDTVRDSTRRGQMEPLLVGLSGPLPHASLPLVDFNLYLLTVRKCNHEPNNFQ